LNTAEQKFRPIEPVTALPVAPIRQTRGFPTWHFSMMNDHARNRAILEAISAIDLKGKAVFEIGTGAGLVAMHFARNGARHVYTCEMDKQLYKLAVQIIALNGLSDRITVIHASSTEFIRSEAFDF
jgi:type II protein arginine methyltransferase